VVYSPKIILYSIAYRGIQEYVPVVMIHGQVPFYIHRFLNDITPLTQPSKTKKPKEPIQAFLNEFLDKADSTLCKNMNNIYSVFCVWLSRMKSILTSNELFQSPKFQFHYKEVEKNLKLRHLLQLNG